MPAGAARFEFHCELVEYLGSEQLAFGTLGGSWAGKEIVWRLPAYAAPPRSNEAHAVVVEERHLRYFDAATGRRTARRPLA